MFRSARWRSEKNRISVVFKLQFHATKVPSCVDDSLTISLVPADSGRPTSKSDAAAVRDGDCLWQNHVYESVKFNRDPKSGKIHERIYHFVLGAGSSKSGVIGEAFMDMSKYVETGKVTTVSLPLKGSKSEAILNISIQRMPESSNHKGHSLRSHLSLEDFDGAVKSNSDDSPTPTSTGSEHTISSSGSSSGVEIPWQPSPVKSHSLPTQLHDRGQRSEWEWLKNSILRARTDDSESTAREKFLRQNSEDSSDIMVDKLKSEVASLSRQLELSEMELQSLRKQVAKESRRGQDLVKELVSLKDERDTFRYENGKNLNGGDKAVVDELRQELYHEKELNSNLRIQLQKTQESNSELILAVKDLDDVLEQKNQEISNLKTGGSLEKTTRRSDYDDVGHIKDAHLLEQQIVDLQIELEMSKREKDEVEMQMEHLALDYEIMKQENHDMANKLQQSRLHEQLKIQYECSPSYSSTTHELESQIQKLEERVKAQTDEAEIASGRIKELEAHVRILEDEFDKQVEVFEAGMEDLIRCKAEQEQRAIEAEEALKKTRCNNANTAERLQEEFRRLSVQMASSFEANERVASKALAEANELRFQKTHLEEMIRKDSEENQSIRDEYEIRLEDVVNQVRLLMDETGKLQSDIQNRELVLQHQKKEAEETRSLLSDEILKLKKENETHLTEIRSLIEQMKTKDNLMEQMRSQMKDLENNFLLAKANAERSETELNKLRSLIEEKEMMVMNLQTELDSFQSQHEELKLSLHEDGLQQENLKKQTSQLKTELKKKEDMLINMEKKMKAGTIKATSKSSRPVSRGSKEVMNLKERIKSLEDDNKLKESALETSSNAFLMKEKDLVSKIKELEERVGCENAADKPERNGDDEVAQLKEMNKSIKAELNEMQDRYSEISLKFAEVEGERQELVMKLRNLQNSQKPS